jgi:hypothetical protein
LSAYPSSKVMAKAREVRSHALVSRRVFECQNVEPTLYPLHAAPELCCIEQIRLQWIR